MDVGQAAGCNRNKWISHLMVVVISFNRFDKG